MTIAKVIRYSIRPEDADDNERLIGEVFTELAVDHPDGLRYAAFRLDDGVSFVHVALVDDDDNPLSRSPASSPASPTGWPMGPTRPTGP
jgi:hypothetical protein